MELSYALCFASWICILLGAIELVRDKLMRFISLVAAYLSGPFLLLTQFKNHFE
jgi:hypothetical protein